MPFKKQDTVFALRKSGEQYWRKRKILLSLSPELTTSSTMSNTFVASLVLFDIKIVGDGCCQNRRDGARCSHKLDSIHSLETGTCLSHRAVN